MEEDRYFPLCFGLQLKIAVCMFGPDKVGIATENPKICFFRAAAAVTERFFHYLLL